ncbi:MAG: hypothetical protein OXQ90_00445 [Gammaproteobacteria bacterium]|nr:hypothetical protein [Gammaproteobacteria bacterium]
MVGELRHARGCAPVVAALVGRNLLYGDLIADNRLVRRRAASPVAVAAGRRPRFRAWPPLRVEHWVPRHLIALPEGRSSGLLRPVQHSGQAPHHLRVVASPAGGERQMLIEIAFGKVERRLDTLERVMRPAPDPAE